MIEDLVYKFYKPSQAWYIKSCLSKGLKIIIKASIDTLANIK
ncbi:hypothetical protein BC624_101398 [Flavobacterium granuli]|uniref:Uncharacterized protein n=1 Tax=Flavobacterium granuli TaxID=280093 RepID=A0A1M5IUE9_9FLAO|nr:hypothetical protein BC624_101398 [Flavobacterium granuli]SHG31795.1 hypothetical protein SAMN05443373_101398 [Flavobacterium granuli]